MFSAPFEYFRASSVDEARKLLHEFPGAKVLAGGHSLLPLLKMRLAQPSALVDVSRIAALKGITASGSSIRIGALTTHAELASSSSLRSACPILGDAAAVIGDPQVRNCGTIGGNVAHADPASDLPTVLVALDAQILSAGAYGERAVPIREFLQGMMTTSLAPDEILTAVDVPARQAGQGMAYVKFSHPASHYAVIGAAAIVSVQKGVCAGVRVAIGGLLPVPRRCPSVEAALAGKPASAESAAQAAAQVSRDLAPSTGSGQGDDLLGDVFASADYRKAMAPVYVKRALQRALERTG
jgi:carbon-monoxide dehydrogenase medium subunit